MRGMGKTTYVYIGRGSQNQGIWKSDLKPDPFLRKVDTFLEYIRKHLSSCTLKNIEIDTKDRILSINYHKWGHVNKFGIFYFGSKLYFSHHFFDSKAKKMNLYRSWSKKSKVISEVNIFETFDEIGRKDLDKKKVKPLVDINVLLKKELELAETNKEKNKSKKFLERKINRIYEDLKRVSRWEQLYELANKENNLAKYPHKTKLFDINIKFEEKDHFKRRNQIFEKAKKLKKAVPILKQRLENTQNSLNNPNRSEYSNKLTPIKPYWNDLKVNSKETSKSENNIIFFNHPEMKIAIGLNAKGNDEARKNWANKEDLWFHMDGDKSSHIFVKLINSVLDQEKLKIIGGAMLEYSKLHYSEVNLIYTAVKNLKGVPGIAGTVNYKKEKRIRVEKIDSWIHYFNKLK